QDSLLPAVEDGTVTLIGATTENPSFEVNGALLSRARVIVLKPLGVEDVERVLRRALEDTDRGLGAQQVTVDEDVLRWIAAPADVGLADPQALQIAIAARDAYHMLGVPEGLLPMTQMLVYLATAPKSGSVKKALHAAIDAARATPGAAVPLHVRNAPTGLMK